MIPASTHRTALKSPSTRCELRYPTVNLACARAILDIDNVKIKELSERGVFPAWNIARGHPAAMAARVEWRFLARDLRNYVECRPITGDEDFITTLMYGRKSVSISGKNFSRSWNCDSGHTCNLIRDGTLQVVKGSEFGRGRGLTALIQWSSAIAFLKDRRIA